MPNLVNMLQAHENMHGPKTCHVLQMHVRRSLILMSVRRIVLKNSCIYSIRHIKFIHMEEACWYRETLSKRFIATLLTTKSHKWRSQQKPSHVPRKKTLYSWLQRKTLKEKPKARSVSSICSKNVQYHDWRLNSRIWAMGLLLIPGTSTSKRMEQNACLKRDLV